MIGFEFQRVVIKRKNYELTFDVILIQHDEYESSTIIKDTCGVYISAPGTDEVLTYTAADFFIRDEKELLYADFLKYYLDSITDCAEDFIEVYCDDKKPTHPFINYYKYIESDEWYELREKCFERDEYVCRLCGSSENLQAHHLSYERLGMNELSDLVTLCRKCHQAVHKHTIIKEFGNEKKSTDNLI